MKPAADPGLAVVLGGASCVWEDLARLERMIGREWPGIYVVINDLGCVWTRRLDSWVTLHPEKFRTPMGWRNPEGGPHGWLALRKLRGYPDPGELCSFNHSANSPRGLVLVKTWGGGASGLLGVIRSYDRGCRKVVVCGCPMDERPHFRQSVEHDPKRGWASYASHFRAWQKPRALKRLRERTRSMSVRADGSPSNTQALLGAPTREWLLG